MDGVEPPVFPEDMRPIWAERLAFMEKKLAAFPRKTPIDLARQTISDTQPPAPPGPEVSTA